MVVLLQMEYFESDTDDAADSQDVSDDILVEDDMLSDDDEAGGGNIGDGSDEDADADMSE